MNTQLESSDNHISSSLKPKKKRLVGLDVFRVLAAYGVVFIHGLGGDASRDTLSNQVSFGFSTFCVPFFLALSFWLLDKRIQNTDPKTLLFTRSRRIIIPFLCWSAIYLAARFGKQLISHDQSFVKVISDPISLLLGGAGVQLYFLPMLLTGTIMAILISTCLQKIKAKMSLYIALFIISVALKLWLHLNEIFFAHGTVLQWHLSVISLEYLDATVRIITVLTNWTIACLPYVFISTILNQYLLDSLLKPPLRKLLLILSIFIFLLSAFLSLDFRRFPLNDLLIAYSALISGILISQEDVRNPLLDSLSKASFGIYLIHGLFTDGLVPVIKKIAPFLVVDNLSLMASVLYSLAIFCISFACTYLIDSNRTTKSVLLGE